MTTELSTALRQSMRMPVAPPKDGNLYTPVFRCAFVHLDEPWAGNDPKGGGEPAFSLIAVFDDDADLRELVGACNNKLTSKFGPKALEMIQHGVYRYPLRPKTVMADRFAGFEGSGFFASLRARKDAPPACMGFNGDKAVMLQQGAIERVIYSGSFCYATVNPFAYDNVGKGVSLGVRTIVKVADGEKFGGPKATTQEEALAAITGVRLPPGLVPTGVTTIEGKAEAPTTGAFNPAALPRMPAGVGADELLDALG